MWYFPRSYASWLAWLQWKRVQQAQARAVARWTMTPGANWTQNPCFLFPRY